MLLLNCSQSAHLSARAHTLHGGTNDLEVVCLSSARRAVSYYLGLTPIRFSAYVAGTAAGRGFWALLYASIGAYSRTWMQRGIGLDGVLQGGYKPAAWMMSTRPMCRSEGCGCKTPMQWMCCVCLQ